MGGGEIRSLDVSGVRLFSDILSGNTPDGFVMDAISHGSLYKYYPNLDAAPEKNYFFNNIDDLLLKDRVFMQIIPKLNDKNECNPTVIGWNNRGAFVDEAMRYLRSKGREPLLHQINKSKSITELAIYERIKSIASANGKLSILCLTTSSNISHMWKKYANYYNGICVEFDTLPYSVFSLAKKVVYQKNIPVLDVSNVFTDTNLISKEKLNELTNYYFIKTVKWKIEDERRLVSNQFEALRAADFKNIFTMIEAQSPLCREMKKTLIEYIDKLNDNYRIETHDEKCYLCWDISPIKSITIGKNVSSKTKELIKQRYTNKLKVFQAL